MDVRYGSRRSYAAIEDRYAMPQTVRVGDALPTAVSETVLVTENGCEVLTDFEPRNLIVVD